MTANKRPFGDRSTLSAKGVVKEATDRPSAIPNDYVRNARWRFRNEEKRGGCGCLPAVGRRGGAGHGHGRDYDGNSGEARLHHRSIMRPNLADFN